MSTSTMRRSGAIQSRNKPSTITPPFQPLDEKALAGGYASLDSSSALVPTAQLGTGTPTGSKALLGDQTWGAIATPGDVAAEAAARAAADALLLVKSANLSDVASAATSRTNLGLGTAATKNVPAAGDAAAGEVVKGDDTRLTNSRAPNGAAGGDLSGTYPSPAVAALAITDAKVAAANKDGAAGTASMRTLGTGAAQACAGNDGRLSDTRTPTDNTVSTAKLQDDAVTYAKIQNVSATDKLLGRSTAGAGDVEEIACTAAGRALIDDAAASNQRTTLGLGSADDVTFRRMVLAILSTAGFTVDTSGSGVSIANNGVATWPAVEAGIAYLYDVTGGGAALIAIHDGSAVDIIWQAASNVFTTTSGTAAKINCYQAGAPAAFNIENKRGSTHEIRGFIWKVA